MFHFKLKWKQSQRLLHHFARSSTQILWLKILICYDAEIQYKRKPPATRLIMCGSLDEVRIDEPVMISYHSGMRCYQHTRHVVTSNEDNCIGGFTLPMVHPQNDNEKLPHLCFPKTLSSLPAPQGPCQNLTEDEQAELDFVPLKTASGQRTALAEEFAVELSTLVVAYEAKL